jgi:hypothetical protein
MQADLGRRISRRSIEGLAGAMGLDASSFGENLAARFARITGVGAALPAAP